MAYERVRTEYKLTKTTTGISDPIIVEADIGIICVALNFPNLDTTAYIQTTLSPDADIEAGTAIWNTWASGTVAIYTEASAYAPNGIRVVNVGSGTVVMLIRGNYGG